ncbi:carbohydrate-binding module family 18 protein [Apiospora phragmitis]|uniref:lytic cellulose monooxygenase (C4-dehydrogenating) n=1 Tax=Apiospora phragmitis TaxID=2905665 RepID=A0ABR1TA43_9PEZI
MACGVDGEKAVNYTCPAGAGSKLTFEWREFANLEQPDSIDISHKGPCAVYIKQVGDMATSTAAGSGWVKIWDEGYDSTTGKWCTEKLIDNDGLLSVQIPTNLPTGNYLVRPELLALHEADKGDPQFYVGCAQVAIKGSGSGKLDVPADYSVSIPGHVKAGEPSVSFNIYQPKFPYTLPGPKVWNTQSAGTPVVKVPSGDNSWITGAQTVPATCLLKNANWCGVEVPDYKTEDGCWKASDACYKRADTCYGTAPPSGSKNCEVWESKCKGIQDACSSGSFQGPPSKGKHLESADPKPKTKIPAAGNVPSGASSGQKKAVVGDTGDIASTKTSNAGAASAETTVAAPAQGKRGCKSKARRAHADLHTRRWNA